MTSPFDGLVYFGVDFENIPSGFLKEEKRNGRKQIVSGVGKRGQSEERLNTCHRKNVGTIFEYDGEGARILVLTAGRFICRVSTNLSNTDLIQKAYEELANELDREVNAVKQLVSIWVIGNKENANVEVSDNPEKWGEQ